MIEVAKFLHDTDELSCSCCEYIEIVVKLSVYVLGRNINSKVATKSAGCEE